MKILALDCSTEACSVALLSDTGQDTPEVQQLFELAPRQHTQRILPLVEQLLSDSQTTVNQLDAIAFGRGPGSFTGLRICLGAVQGLAFGADLPVIPISTLAAQAQQFVNDDGAKYGSDSLIVSTLDARMDEIYWAVFQSSEAGLVSVGSERLSSPEKLLVELSGQNNVIIGAGLNYAPRISQLGQFEQYPKVLPTAAAVASLGLVDFRQGISYAADQALPIYLRDEVAWQKQAPLT
jgi:tRNA threonylcarbamoyladenosine biosynthesis protein TsaB